MSPDGENRRAGMGGFTAKQVLIVVLVLVVVVLAIVNSQSIRVDFLIADVTLPLFVVIVGSAAIGWVIGWFSGRNRT